MKKNLLRGIFCLVSLTIVFLVNAQSPTAPAQSFNIFLKNGAKLVTNETEGPIALGGDLEVAGNYQVNIHNNGTFTAGNIPIGLLVGGKLTLTSGSLQVNNGRYVKIGNCAASNVKVWYRDNNNAASNIYVTTASGSYASTPNININSNCLSWGSPEVSASNKPICDANTASLIDFNAAFTSFQANSLSLSSCSTTGVDLTNPNGNVHGTTITSVLTGGQLKINLGSGTNVLNCTGAELNSVTNGITFNTQPDASHVLVINVNASGSFTWNVWNQAGIGSSNASYIIYNFYNCTSLNIAGNSTIEGTVFAPLADITKTVNQSNIEGQVIGLSFYQSGGEVHYYPFTPSVTGCSPSCTTPATPTVSITQPTCATATGTITVTAPTGAGYTYSIDGTTYQSSTVFSGINAGSYNVTAKSGTCVSIATTAVVNAQPTAPSTPVVSITQPTCSVATGTITVTSPTGAGYTYSIDGTTYQSGVTFSNVASGTYTVYVKNAGGCITSLANTIINAAPSAPAAPAVSITQPTCSVATGTITVTSPTGAGYTYSIDGTTYQSSVTFTNVATGNYTVYVKNAGGCSNTASATINAQPVTPTVASITGSNTVCIGGTTALTDVTAGGVWSTSDATIATIDNTGIVAGVAAGSVTITYTVSNACGTAFKTLLMSVTDCSVNGGGSGGLESKSLGDAVAKRMYNKAVNNQLGAVDYGKLPSPQVQTGNI
ncbi:MAG: choice-of-anchor A family protein, partial [Sphingobacteriia bacterium]|nr:choice-of-anchor A family protein [Sphingobacteriia bacterium]